MPSDSLQTSISQTDGVTSQRWRRSQCKVKVCVCVCVPLTLAGVQHQVLVVLGRQRELMFGRVEYVQQ